VFEALLVRQSQSGNSQLEYLAGVRWWDNDIDVAVDPAVFPGTATVEIKEDWIDLVLGIRWSKSINDNWTINLRGDIGGLGVESDFTSTISAGFHYDLTDSVDLDLQYKATWVDFETGSSGEPGYFQYDTLTHGPLIGVIFNF
jgi:opacity protein-like surface antigen